MKILTRLEQQMIKDIINCYGVHGVENTEFNNLYPLYSNGKTMNEIVRKELRGTFTSLKRKKIVEHYNDKGCFNPIFPTQKLIDVCNSYCIKIDESTLTEIQRYL